MSNYKLFIKFAVFRYNNLKNYAVFNVGIKRVRFYFVFYVKREAFRFNHENLTKKYVLFLVYAVSPFGDSCRVR